MRTLLTVVFVVICSKLKLMLKRKLCGLQSAVSIVKILGAIFVNMRVSKYATLTND